MNSNTLPGYITAMTITPLFCSKPIDIVPMGKDLIIIGKNGSGKTNILNKIATNLISISENRALEQSIINDDKILACLLKPTKDINGENLIDIYRNTLRTITPPGNYGEKINNGIYFSDRKKINKSLLERRAVLLFFPSSRSFISSNRLDNSEVSSIMSTVSLKSIYQSYTVMAGVFSNIDSTKKDTNQSYFLNYLKSQLVNTMLEHTKNNKESSYTYPSWFLSLNEDLKFLFENDKIILDFDISTFIIQLKIADKPIYRLENLPSGFSSILNIYLEIFMFSVMQNIENSELQGIVIIDEIDAHLHISLQKKILSFLKKSFPKIQFIVSTHSPFVINSIENCIVYDLETKEQMEDLHMYSYTSIVKGLLGQDIESEFIRKRLTELKKEIKDNNIEKINFIVSQLEPHYSTLSTEAKLTLITAKDLTEEGGNGHV